MKNVNPLSALYNVLYYNLNEIKNIFGDIEFLFLGEQSYFKINFSKVEMTKSNLALLCRNIEKLKIKDFVII